MSKCSTVRTYRFRVRLTRDGRRWLDDRLAAHCRRYNAALQERRDAWRMARRSISFAYGEGYVSICRVIRPAISVTSTASAGSRATFVVYDCNSTGATVSQGAVDRAGQNRFPHNGIFTVNAINGGVGSADDIDAGLDEMRSAANWIESDRLMPWSN